MARLHRQEGGSAPFNPGFYTRHLGILFTNPTQVLLMYFEVLFKILSAYCVRVCDGRIKPLNEVMKNTI